MCLRDSNNKKGIHIVQVSSTDCRKYTYILTVESNPVGDSQSIDKDSEESLVVGICNAHEVRIILLAHIHGIIPA